MPTKSKPTKKSAKKSARPQQHTTALTLGDWSDDGHGKTATVTISSTLPTTDVLKAFKAGMKKLGEKSPDHGWAVGAYLPICEDYEDASVPSKFLKKLIAKGFDIQDLEDGDEPDDALENVTVHVAGYANIWLFIAALGNPKFTYTLVENAELCIGGYGIFSS